MPRIAALALVSLVLVAASADDGWTTFAPEGGRFEVRMPSSATTKVEKVPDYNGFLNVFMLSANEKGLLYTVHYHDINRRLAASERDSFLRKQVDGSVRKNNGALRTEKKVTLDGKPCRDLVVDMPIEGGGSAVLRAKIVLDDTRVYQVFVWATEKKAERPEIAEFLDSFHLKPAADSAPAKAKAKVKGKTVKKKSGATSAP